MVGAIMSASMAFADSSVNVVVRIARTDGDVHHAILDSRTPQLTIASPQEAVAFVLWVSWRLGSSTS